MQGNPLIRLQAVLDLLVGHAEVLPASGRAVVELATPSAEELYDLEDNRETRIQGIWETEPVSFYRSVPPIHRREEHFLRFFGRGSTKVLFLGVLLEHGESTPIQIAQIGVTILERRDNGLVTIADDAVVTALVLDTKALSDSLRTAIEAAMPDDYQLWNTGLRHDPRERRLRGAREANERMRDLCRQMAGIPGRDYNNWLVLGQSLGNEFTTWHGPPLLGVTQSFQQERLFKIQKQERSLYQLLAELPADSRTAVFPREWQGHRGEIVFWYIRIRDAHRLDFPLAGVIRAEIPNRGGEKVETALVDRLSQHLIAERTVAPYGTGPGWHAQLYPLHLAERVVQGRFHSEEVVKAGLRFRLP